MSRAVLVSRFALISLCVLVAAIGSAWSAWDMFSAEQRPILQGSDDSYYYVWLPSVVIDHDLDFRNQFSGSQTLQPSARREALEQPPTPTGLLPNKFPPGWAIGSLPFFLLAHVSAPPDATGFEPRYLLATWIGQLLYAAAGLWLAIKIVSRFFPEQPASLVVLGTWLASPLIYYQSARLTMAHSQVFTLAMAVFWLSLKIYDGDQRTRTWAALGFCSALLVVTRNIALLYLALPFWVVIGRLRSTRNTIGLLLGAAGPAAAQLIAWKILFGTWIAYSYGSERFNFSDWHTLEILFSPRHGWFYWHPLILVGVLAFCTWSIRNPLGRIWLVSLAGIIVLNSTWPTWWLGSSFGNRGFEACTLFVMIGIAALLHWTTARSFWRTVLATTCAVAIAWNLLLLSLFLTHRISRQERVTYAECISATAEWLRDVH